MRRLLCSILLALSPTLAPIAFAQDGKVYTVSSLGARYSSRFQEPDIAERVPKNIFTFDNTSSGDWWSSYLFVDVLRSWSDADANAKEVYGEWYPSVSLRGVSGRKAGEGLLRDVSLTIGLNTGVRSTGPSPFAVLPGATFAFNVPGFTFVSLGAYAYIDRGRFQGQPSNCQATTYQITPSFSLPFYIGAAKMKLDGFVDFIGKHANCEAMVLTEPRLTMDLSRLWHKPGHVYVGVDWLYWHNKYGIKNLKDNLFLPVVIWVM